MTATTEKISQYDPSRERELQRIIQLEPHLALSMLWNFFPRTEKQKQIAKHMHKYRPALLSLMSAWQHAEAVCHGLAMLNLRSFQKHPYLVRLMDAADAQAKHAMQQYLDAKHGHGYNPILPVVWPNLPRSAA